MFHSSHFNNVVCVTGTGGDEDSAPTVVKSQARKCNIYLFIYKMSMCMLVKGYLYG